jgi:uncharacterized protein YaaN involved in tellurite resistance
MEKTKLEPPAAVKQISTDSASNMVELDKGEISALNTQVDTFIDELFSKTRDFKAFGEKLRTFQHLGENDIQRASEVSSRLLERPINTISSGIFDGGSPISQALQDLRNTVEELDPSNNSKLLSPKKILGLFTLGTQIKKYFRKYQSAQSHLNAIICSLNNGKDELLKDNAAIEEEKFQLWEIMQSLERNIYFAKQLDASVVRHVKDLEKVSTEKAKLVKDELLFYLRQKQQDLLTQLTVSIQGYLAMNMIQKNNIELIKGIDRSTNTTVSALRTAVTVAQALANERLVLDQITALNNTTSTIIEKTSEILKNQAAAVHNKAVGNTIEIDKIKNAFSNIYETFEMIDNFKSGAMDQMAETIEVLSNEVNKATVYIQHTRQVSEVEQ